MYILEYCFFRHKEINKKLSKIKFILFVIKYYKYNSINMNFFKKIIL